MSHNFPANKKTKVSSSNKCNKSFGQSCRENFWTPNKSDPWGEHIVTTLERQKQRYPRSTRCLCVFTHRTLSICRDSLFLSSYVPCTVHFAGNRLLTNDILPLTISITIQYNTINNSNNQDLKNGIKMIYS